MKRLVWQASAVGPPWPSKTEPGCNWSAPFSSRMSRARAAGLLSIGAEQYYLDKVQVRAIGWPSERTRTVPSGVAHADSSLRAPPRLQCEMGER